MEKNATILKKPEYNFLRAIKEPILFLNFGGSIAYGTNTHESDVDIRGVRACKKSELLGFSKAKVIDHKATDTRIYGLKDVFPLWYACNPECIEMLGCKPEHYLHIDPIGQMLLDNRKLFLSKKAIYSFGGYVNSQLRELNLYLNNGEPSKEDREEQLLRSIKHMVESFTDRYSSFSTEDIKFYLKNEEIYTDMKIDGMPLRELAGVTSELANIKNAYCRIQKRNRKKDEKHLNKHIMHLFRLYFMGLDILEKQEIKTYREKEHDFLMKVRAGHFLNEGKLIPEFLEAINSFETKMAYAAKHTTLPDKPNTEKLEELLIAVNEESLKKEK